MPDSDFPYLPYGWSGDRSWESFDLGVQCGSLEVAIAVAVWSVAFSPAQNVPHSESSISNTPVVGTTALQFPRQALGALPSAWEAAQ